MKGYVRKSRLDDIGWVSADMRDADVAEVKAASGLTPGAALYKGRMATTLGGQCLTAIHPDGTPVAMYGVAPDGDAGVVWMLATNKFHTLNRQIIRESRERILELGRDYKLLYNFTDARNHVHHRWLQWAGFTIIKRHEEYGVERRPFLEFVRIME